MNVALSRKLSQDPHRRCDEGRDENDSGGNFPGNRSLIVREECGIMYPELEFPGWIRAAAM